MDGATVNAHALEGHEHWDPPTGVSRLHALLAALPTCRDPDALQGLASGLPRDVVELAPEVCLALAELALALAPYQPTLPREVGSLPTRLRLAWHRAALASGSPDQLDQLSDADLLLAITDWPLDSWTAPLPILERALGSTDARLRSRGLSLLTGGVEALAVTPVGALRWVTRLTADPEPRVRQEAVTLLGVSWATLESQPDQRSRTRAIASALRDRDAAVVHAAIRAGATVSPDSELTAALRVVARDATHPLREVALEALGDHAVVDDLALALRLGASEPHGCGAGARRLVLAAHRRGVFLREHQLEAVLACFDAHGTWTAEELVRVTHIARHALVTHLGELPADDPRWVRRAAILGHSVGTAAHLLLEQLMAEVTDLENAAALVTAAATNPDYTAEEPLLRLLDELPDVVLPALAVKGGPRTYTHLLAWVLNPTSPAGDRARAIDVLWSLALDRDGLLRELTVVLGPREAGLLQASRRELRDARVAGLVAEAAWGPNADGAPTPAAEFDLLCGCGDFTHLPRIVELFRSELARVVQLAIEGDFTIKRAALPQLEQTLFRYGRRMVEAGRTVRRYHDATPQTGRDLVLRVALDWLHEGPEAAVCVALLEVVGRHSPSGMTLRAIEPFWRHSAREVQRAAIEAILSAGSQARGLELSLCRLGSSEEPRLVVQALTAIGTLGARWAEGIAIEALERPEMGVKKEAARALAQVGGARAVGPLVRWLATHDNRALRAELSRALTHAAGASSAAALVDALAADSEAFGPGGDHAHVNASGARDPRSVQLLHDALSGVLSLNAAVRLARSERPSDLALVTACLEGKVKLADGSASALAAALHRARRLPSAHTPDPTRRLRVEGFSPEAAQQLLDTFDATRAESTIAMVRHGLAEWVRWLEHEPAVLVREPRALELLLDAAERKHVEHFSALIELARHPGATPAPRSFLDFVERCVVPAGAPDLRARCVPVVRTLPDGAGAGGLRRFELLARLGAVRSDADLTRCLAVARRGPDFVRESAALLGSALQLPPVASSDSEQLKAWRRGVADWYRLSEDEQAHWLREALRERPVDVVLPPPLRACDEPPEPVDVGVLLQTLADGDPQARTSAAAALLESGGAANQWPAVLEAFFADRITVTPGHQARLAGVMRRWPGTKGARRAAARLLPSCPEWRQRAFVAEWVSAWMDGDADLGVQLEATPEERLLPHVRAAAERGDYRLVGFLSPTRSFAGRRFVEWLAQREPELAERLRPRQEEPGRTTAEGERRAGDPLVGLGVDGLADLVARGDTKRGLAVRAIHALTAQGEAATVQLSALALDERGQVRSAALRGLKKVAPRSVSLPVTLSVLAIEDRRDVIIQLLKSLGHARHEPALPVLLEHCLHKDRRIAEGAREAVEAWGEGALPAVIAAARRARPDRRGDYEALADALTRIGA